MNNVLVKKTIGLALITLLLFTSQCVGQGLDLDSRVEVNDASDTIEIIAGSSRRLSFPYDVPEIMIENPEILTASAITSNEIIVRGLKPGITTLSVMNPSRDLQTIQINVVMDVRKLERTIKMHYADSNVTAHALNAGVMLKGTVAKQAQIANIVQVAQEYFPNVINEISVHGAKQVLIEVKVYEVSRSKLRKLGVDWGFNSAEFSAISSISDLISSAVAGTRAVAGGAQDFTVGVVNNGTSLDLFFEAIEQQAVAKLLDQPVLVAEHGRPAEFLSGGEIPIPIASGLGTTSIEFRPFGTKLDIVPLIQSQSEIKLEVRAEVSEQASDLSNGTNVPGFRVRRVNTSVSMLAGHTLALAGDIREEVEAESRGAPGFKHNPIFGPLFRRVEDTKTESELVFLITPRFISEVDPSQLPPQNLGQLTDRPSNYEFYRNGYIEVPKCNDDCPANGLTNQGVSGMFSKKQTLDPRQKQLALQKQIQELRTAARRIELEKTGTVAPRFGQQQPKQQLQRKNRFGGLFQSKPQAKSNNGNGFFYPTRR